MNTTTTLPFAGAEASDRPAASTAPRSSLRWVAPLIVFGGACIVFGILWDISWHSTIGRDTFWTPAHMLLYMGGTLGGCLAGWLAIEATFLKRDALRGLCVDLHGGRAPLGAWVQGEAQVLRVTRTMVFAQGLATADGVNAVRVSGIFKLGAPFAGIHAGDEGKRARERA